MFQPLIKTNAIAERIDDLDALGVVEGRFEAGAQGTLQQPKEPRTN